jgi:hypothetical protein
VAAVETAAIPPAEAANDDVTDESAFCSPNAEGSTQLRREAIPGGPKPPAARRVFRSTCRKMLERKQRKA